MWEKHSERWVDSASSDERLENRQSCRKKIAVKAFYLEMSEGTTEELKVIISMG